MKYVELNLFTEEEEECEMGVGSKGNQEYAPSVMKDYDLTDLFDMLSKSNFRSRFTLSARDKAYIAEKGLTTIRKHAENF